MASEIRRNCMTASSMVTGSAFERDRSGQAPRRDQAVAVLDQLRDFFPIDFADVEAQPDPASRSDVGGHVEFFRVGGDQRDVVAGEDFAIDADDAVAVVVVEEIAEGFLADGDAGVAATQGLACGFGKREADVSEASEAGVFFNWFFGHLRSSIATSAPSTRPAGAPRRAGRIPACRV